MTLGSGGAQGARFGGDGREGLFEQAGAERRAVIGAPAEEAIGDDTAHFVGAVGAEADAIGELERGAAVTEPCRRAAPGVAATGAAGPGADDQGGAIVLEDGRELLG